MRELFSVSVDEDDNIVIRSVLLKDELKELLMSIVESIDNDKAFEIKVNNDDKPKYLA